MVVHDLEIGKIEVCGKCGGVKGSVEIAGTRYPFSCMCEKGRETNTVPPGYDFTPVIDLCFCCGLTPIKSGSRWSVFFCADCLERVKNLNKYFEAAVIPIGRHSLMNSVGLSTRNSRSRYKVSEFAKSLSGFFQRTTLVSDWRRIVVLRNYAALDFDHNRTASLQEYLICADGAVRQKEKEKAFRRMAAWMDVPDFYFAPRPPQTSLVN